MMMNLDKIISNFISGTIELNDVIEKNDISYFSLVKLIKNYCYSNKIPIVKDISYRLNTPIREMLDLRSHGMSYRKLAEKYKCTSDAIRQGLIKYCEEKNIDFPEVNRGPKKKKIPMKEIYELKSQGLTYKEIAEKYDCGIMTIRRRLKEYEEELVLRNKYLEILLQDFTRIKDDILNKTIGSFYDDKENKIHDDYSFIKK